jgi:hypothetical protein
MATRYLQASYKSHKAEIVIEPTDTACAEAMTIRDQLVAGSASPDLGADTRHLIALSEGICKLHSSAVQKWDRDLNADRIVSKVSLIDSTIQVYCGHREIPVFQNHLI